MNVKNLLMTNIIDDMEVAKLTIAESHTLVTTAAAYPIGFKFIWIRPNLL